MADTFRPPLSKSVSFIAWLPAFAAVHHPTVSRLVDALLLLNDEDVSSSIHSQLRNIALGRRGKRRKVALFVEREYPQAEFFVSEPTLDKNGKTRKRAVGNTGPAAVKPNRGGVRVGSEGSLSSLLSQASAANKKVYLNNPGPDRIRRHKISTIAIVTDLIGTGSRIVEILDKFMATPSVRAWYANKWIDFIVVSAAATKIGLTLVEAHRTQPKVYCTHIVPTIYSFQDGNLLEEWMGLFKTYGPREARGASSAGFKENGALIAFSYRTPNNTPLLLHVKKDGWVPLFNGPISDDMRAAFGLKPLAQRLAKRSVKNESEQLTTLEARAVLVLRSLRGRWRPGQEIALAEMTGLTVPEVLIVKGRATSLSMLSPEGRLTDAGHKLLQAASEREKRRPDIPTRPESYYPLALRTPRSI